MTTPSLDLPQSQGYNVKLSVINGSLSRLPAGFLVDPTIKGHEEIRLANYSFLIESTNKDQKVLFDLAFMKDVDKNMPPALKKLFENVGGGIESITDVPDTLTQHDLILASINAIILSHQHIDHVGDPSVFPPTTDLIVGPTFRAKHMPGYPTNPKAFMLDSAFQGRNVREMDFSRQSTLTIGGFRAIDFFEDGSFYLLETTGHTLNHMSALARTSDDSFVLMAGDACHHVGQLRPSEHLPFPASFSPDALAGMTAPMTGCSCSQFKSLVPSDKGSSSFYGLQHASHEDPTKAEDALHKLKAFDMQDDVLVIIAHDASLVDILDFYPKTLNDWRQKRLNEVGKWRFLGDFKNSVAQS